MDKRELCKKWVDGLDTVDPMMRMTLLEDSGKDLKELTLPIEGNRVYYDGYGFGEIIDIEHGLYTVAMDNIDSLGMVDLERDEFTLFHTFTLPEWGRMWKFGKDSDIKWLENNLQTMSDLGFRIYSHKDIGYFFGIDGSGYDFFEKHWIPLYEARERQLNPDTQNAPALKAESHDAKEAAASLSGQKSDDGKVVIPSIKKSNNNPL